MDVMCQLPDGRVAPAPWLFARSAVEVPTLNTKALTLDRDASGDEIPSQLAAWEVQVSVCIISMWLQK